VSNEQTIRSRAIAHLLAMIVLPSLAKIAPQAWNSGLESDSISDLVRVHAWADLCYDTGALMAEAHGLGEYKVSDTTMAPVVHVTAADT
jgi:hypothetical protein